MWLGFQAPARDGGLFTQNIDCNLLQKGEVALPTAESAPPSKVITRVGVGIITLFPFMPPSC